MEDESVRLAKVGMYHARVTHGRGKNVRRTGCNAMNVLQADNWMKSIFIDRALSRTWLPLTVGAAGECAPVYWYYEGIQPFGPRRVTRTSANPLDDSTFINGGRVCAC